MTDQAPESAEHSLVGQTIAGRYRVLDLLGQGGMGCVYTAEQQMGTTVRKVAVKTLHKHLSLDPQVKARFQRECGTVAQLTHPNTIQVFDFGTTEDGTLYIVMELVQGRSLADIIEKEGAMAPDRAEKILRQVCGSLGEAHSHGIVHRDLKPDNVVLCERAGQKDWVEVLDFGIAKRSSENDPNEAKLTQQGMVLGTPPYMSPEQFTGQPIDGRSDIYALGVMAYEMLTGQLPFAANTAWEWASQHMTAQPTPFEARPQGGLLPAGMKQTIMKALAKSPNDRFATVSEFMDAFASNAAAAPPPVSADAGRMKTELAQPAVAGFVGQAPAPGAYGAPPASPAPLAAVAAYTPAPDAAGEKSGPNKGLLLGIAGGVAVLSAIAIFFATRSSGPKPVDPISLTTAATTPTTVAAADTAADAAAATADPATTETVAPLGGGTATGTGRPSGGGGGTAKPPASGKPPATASTPAGKPQPPVCISAQAAKARGMTGPTYESLAAKCRAAGGTP